MSRLIIWGAGELGGRVAQPWLTTHGPVLALTKSAQHHAVLRATGIQPQQGTPLPYLTPADTLLLSLPGHATQMEAIQTLLKQAVPVPPRVVLISSTGYYGMAPRGIINETSPPGQHSRAVRIATMEQTFQTWAGERGLIIRFGGLYHATRGPLPALARRGSPLLRPPDKPLALIHYDDAASATYAALSHPAPESLYVGLSPPCPTRQEFYTLACATLNLPAPLFDSPLGYPPAHYDITRFRRDLLPSPTYPDWRAAVIPV